MANPLVGAGPKVNLAASVRDLLHDVRLIRNCLEAQLERLDRIELELSQLVPCSRAAGQNAPALESGPVAHNLEIRRLPDGSVKFAIDGGSSFSLGPRLAEVFQFLASGDKNRNGSDALVGWRSRMEVSAFLEKHSGKLFRTSYINGMVYLLKKALRKAGYDAKLIQTHRQKGIRLAYKPSTQRPPHQWPYEDSPVS
jgi:hypothetical protein